MPSVSDAILSLSNPYIRSTTIVLDTVQVLSTYFTLLDDKCFFTRSFQSSRAPSAVCASLYHALGYAVTFGCV